MFYLLVFLFSLTFPDKVPPLEIFPDIECSTESSEIIPPLISTPDSTNIETVPDLFFECQIAELSRTTRIPLFYDETVRHYINLYFTERKNQIAPILAKSNEYFPIFQKHLEKSNLPHELKYLPILESALSATAVSASEAVGLWQFKKETGIHYGLRIDQDIDERINPEASTIAACKYLSEIYSRFGDWHITLMAYQAGPGTIQRAIEASGGKTSYHDLYNFLPEQTQKYLPAYVAMIYIFTNYKNHCDCR